MVVCEFLERAPYKRSAFVPFLPRVSCLVLEAFLAVAEKLAVSFFRAGIVQLLALFHRGGPVSSPYLESSQMLQPLSESLPHSDRRQYVLCECVCVFVCVTCTEQVWYSFFFFFQSY